MRLNVVCWLEICVWVRLVVSSTKNKHWTYWMFLKFLHEFLQVYIFLFRFQAKFCSSIFQSFILKRYLITYQLSKEYKIKTSFKYISKIRDIKYSPMKLNWQVNLEANGHICMHTINVIYIINIRMIQIVILNDKFLLISENKNNINENKFSNFELSEKIYSFLLDII